MKKDIENGCITRKYVIHSFAIKKRSSILLLREKHYFHPVKFG